MYNEVLTYIATNHKFNEWLNNIISDKQQREDLTGILIDYVIKEDIKKITTLVDNGQILYYLIRIAMNQYNSNTSKYHKVFRNNNLPNAFTVHTINDIDLIDEDIQPDVKRSSKSVINDINECLNTQYSDFYVNQYHQVLFELYYFRKMKLREITEATGINKDAISRSINKTKKYLKTKINLYDNN